MSECEGFICPYCLVSFSHQTQLEQHFVEMHSGQGVVEQDDYDVVEYVEEEVCLHVRMYGLGHWNWWLCSHGKY